jgi:hypothetical protein
MVPSVSRVGHFRSFLHIYIYLLERKCTLKREKAQKYEAQIRLSEFFQFVVITHQVAVAWIGLAAEKAAGTTQQQAVR